MSLTERITRNKSILHADNKHTIVYVYNTLGDMDCCDIANEFDVVIKNNIFIVSSYN